MEILVTGGAGYIGSSICSALLDRGDTPIILDSLVTGIPKFCRDLPFYEGDIAQKGLLARIRSDYPRCQTVIHCASRIIVSESMLNPYLYFHENVAKSLEFLNEAVALGFDRMIFSSSASVYGVTREPMVDETSLCQPISPYAHSKRMVETMIESFCAAYQVKALCLRYFNPIGADPQLRTGQLIKNPSHLLGRLLDTLAGKYPALDIYGQDWPTRDGTAIRDFIHVWDLAAAHLAGVDFLQSPSNGPGAYEVINIGTGRGTTVKEFVDAFQALVPSPLNVRMVGRREGDIVGSYTNAEKALRLLNWQAKRPIEEGIRDSLRWMASQQDGRRLGSSNLGSGAKELL